MEEKYRLLYFKYLYELLDLGKYEKELEDNKIEYISHKELMCDEEIVCSIVSKYFYLLNEVDLTDLTEQDKNILNSIDVNVLDDAVKSFLERTYRSVLIRKSDLDDVLYYGPFMNPSFEANINDIALGIKYNEFGFVNGVLKEIEEIDNNDRIVKEVIGKIESSSTNPKIKVIKYNEIYEKLNEDNSFML